MASPSLRGLLGSSFQLTVTIGLLAAYALGKLPLCKLPGTGGLPAAEKDQKKIFYPKPMNV